MKRLVLSFIAIIFLASCAKEDTKACYTCTQKYSYRVQDNIPAHDEIKTTEECGKTYKDIVTLKQATQGEETAVYTSYQLECVREQ